ncbi:hypothetical protein [Rhodococcus sp. IEGM 1379]|uniref:hypothetical protein n=1 Tax=Rhodococcus sp. IEGM 1379 TaxID=3047086 RepID=UPI0024B85276|nr:hypothetical protein [Rhodococcus sp. IEGM 1379]MDI9915792.1 hypothetical protein [Rhodococcus sp. IEGM 1379]
MAHNMSGYRIESDAPLTSDWRPLGVFDQLYDDIEAAIPIAIEGVDEPGITEVRVVDVKTGDVVWRSTDEEYEDHFEEE